MAESGIPWSIKGISAFARAAAREAAKRAGLPLGAWLARTIQEIAAAESRERRYTSPVEVIPPDAPKD